MIVDRRLLRVAFGEVWRDAFSLEALPAAAVWGDFEDGHRKSYLSELRI